MLAPTQIALWSVLLVTLIISVITDVLHRRILDVVTYPAVLAALALRWWWDGVGSWDKGLISGLVAGAGSFLCFALLAWSGKMGWGDAKLMAAVGATLGFPLVLAALVFTSIVGAIQALIVLLWKGEFRRTVAAAIRRWGVAVRVLTIDGTSTATRRIPYGVAIAAGSVWAMVWDRTNIR